MHCPHGITQILTKNKTLNDISRSQQKNKTLNDISRMQQKYFSFEIDDLLIFVHCLFLFIYFFISRNANFRSIRPDIIDLLTKYNIFTCIHSYLQKRMFLTNAGWIKKFVNSPVLNHLFNSQNKPFAMGPGMYTVQMCNRRQSPEFNLVKITLATMHEIILCLNLLLNVGLFFNIQSTQSNPYNLLKKHVISTNFANYLKDTLILTNECLPILNPQSQCPFFKTSMFVIQYR